MPADDSLKRLGGGRWETRDGRFAIEPQSGTWVVVDTTQTDDLGLPLVRGPFGSLTAAKEAIEGIRVSGPAESPLADRLKQAEAARTKQAAAPAGRPSGKAGGARKASSPAPAPETPPGPKWLRDLDPADRRRARELIERLEGLDVGDAEAIARSEIVRDQPAMVRLALERAVRHAIASTRSPSGAARAIVEIFLSGRDKELDVRWRLVDDRGRPIERLEITD